MQLLSGGVRFTWKDAKSSGYCTFQKQRMDEIEKKVKAEIKSGKKMIIKEVKTTAKKTFAPGLYDLTELQRDANKRFGYSAKETLNIMQRRTLP